MSVNLHSDVSRIAEEFRVAKNRGRPFALLTGAGCSISAGIPSAASLLGEIKDKYKHRFLSVTSETKLNYGHCMGKLSPNERKDILSPYLDKAKVNWENLAIASMLSSGYINQVLTFNFDHVLEQACWKHQHYVPTYDFGVSPTKNLEYIAKGAIIHLHGQSYGMTMMNSENQTKDHARKLRPLLLQTAQQYPLLIIGYSGEADAVFPVLRSLYTKSQREKLIWCSYGSSRPGHLDPLFSKGTETSEFIAGVDAEIFLVNLAKELGCWPPPFLSNPKQHALETLSNINPYPSELGSDDLLSNVRSLLNLGDGNSLAASTLRRVRLMLDGNYKEIIRLSKSAKPELDIDATIWAYRTQGTILRRQVERQGNENIYESIIECYRCAYNLKKNRYDLALEYGNSFLILADFQSEHAPLYFSFDQIEKNFEECLSKIERANELKPESAQVFCSWGRYLLSRARFAHMRYGADECFKIRGESIKKFRVSVQISPNMMASLLDLGKALLNQNDLRPDPQLVADAKEILDSAELLDPSQCYTRAGLAALQGDEAGCQQRLEKCQAMGKMEKFDRILGDPYLRTMHGKSWFQELVRRQALASNVYW